MSDKINEEIITQTKREEDLKSQDIKIANKRQRKKILISLLVFCVLIPICVALSIIFGANQNYMWISMAVAVLACVPFFISFEKREQTLKKLVLVAVLCAISVVLRIAFAFIPFFKPVTAVVIIAGLALGMEAGFMTGAISAIVSNLYFGQGMWTPFQMLAWGIVGFVAGIISKTKFKKNIFVQSAVAILGGICFSMMLDVFVVTSIDGVFNIMRYFAVMTASLPVMLIYCVSNIVFLFVLSPILLKSLDRVIIKYGVN